MHITKQKTKLTICIYNYHPVWLVRLQRDNKNGIDEMKKKIILAVYFNL